MATHVLDGNLSHAGSPAAGPLRRFAAWRAKRRAKAQIRLELSSYTDRELADLGISRADIPDILRGAYRRY